VALRWYELSDWIKDKRDVTAVVRRLSDIDTGSASRRPSPWAVAIL